MSDIRSETLAVTSLLLVGFLVFGLLVVVVDYVSVPDGLLVSQLIAGVCPERCDVQDKICKVSPLQARKYSSTGKCGGRVINGRNVESCECVIL